MDKIPAKFMFHRNLIKNINILLGICSGLVADNDLNDTEIHFLATWLSDNEEVARSWPGSVIAQRISTIIADGQISADERDDLLATIKEICGTEFTDIGAAEAQSTALPVQQVERIDVDGRSFCFTGQFLYGSRGKCASAVVERGGFAQQNVTKTLNYLVIGSLASPDWQHQSFGTKIKKAVELRDSGSGILIMSEQDWIKHIGLMQAE